MKDFSPNNRCHRCGRPRPKRVAVTSQLLCAQCEALAQGTQLAENPSELKEQIRNARTRLMQNAETIKELQAVELSLGAELRACEAKLHEMQRAEISPTQISPTKKPKTKKGKTRADLMAEAARALGLEGGKA